MDFNAKLRLIGFYNKPDQNMKCEDSFVEEANTLASLLGVSFASLLDNEETDTFFKEVLTGNVVFILKNEDNWLFAYYPKKQIARISRVVFNKNDINSVPLKYKSWFVPGYPVEIKQTSQYKISTRGKDIFISYNGKELPLEWNEGYISVKELHELLECKYTMLSETQTSCGFCDGYDYTYCDRDRCRKESEIDYEACKGCGGRRYICTEERCFTKRYDNVYQISHSEEVDSLQSKIIDISTVLCTPHFQDTERVLSENKSLIDEFLSVDDYLSTYRLGLYEAREAYSKFTKLQECRDAAHQSEQILVTVGNEYYKVSADNIRVKEDGLFFIDYYLAIVR